MTRRRKLSSIGTAGVVPFQRQKWWQLIPTTWLIISMICSIQDVLLSHCHVHMSSTIFVHSFIYPSSGIILTENKIKDNASLSIIQQLEVRSIHNVCKTLGRCSNTIRPTQHNYDHSYSSVLFASRAVGRGRKGSDGEQATTRPFFKNRKRYQSNNNINSRTTRSSSTTGGPNLNSNAQNDDISLLEVDVRHNSRTALVYDPTIERYVDCSQYEDNAYVGQKDATSNGKRGTSSNTVTKLKKKMVKTISNAFLPEGVTESYYKYIKWRIIQRFINANVHVFGTQSLLMGLGKQNRKVSAGASALGLSAVFNWVLKDALGKIVRMVWASRMGRKFDPDAKRWRFRSSLLFAIGNGLEVMTYVYPSLFLLLATMANACKQMGMLTSSATRNALYNSFRDGTRENIGDITAKGEAQIAIVDLMGIVSGVCLSSK